MARAIPSLRRRLLLEKSHVGNASNAHIMVRRSIVSDTDKDTLASPFQGPLHILGAGSIGLFLAAKIRLMHPNFAVKVLLRDHHAARIIRPDRKNESGTGTICVALRSNRPEATAAAVPTASTKRQLHPHTVFCPAELISRQQHLIHNVILTTKAFQAEPAMQSIRHLLADDARILVLCNGALFVQEQLLRSDLLLDDDNNSKRLYLGSITHGVYQEPFPNEHDDDDLYGVVHAGVGQVFVPAALHSWAQLLQRSQLHCQTQTDAEMQRTLWYKLATNCVFNPLTGLHQCTNGELRAMVPDLEHLVLAIVTEVAAVAQQAHHIALSVHELQHFCQQVLHDNVDNKSSMQQDVYWRRPTEIAALNGYVTALAQQNNVPCPVNANLVQQIQQLESSYLTKA